MNDVVGSVVEAVGQLSPHLVLCVAALFMALETTVLVGVFVPADAVVVLAGTTVAGPGNYLALVAATAAGSLLGEVAGYRIGRRFGPGIRRSRLGRRLSEEQWRRAEAFWAGRAWTLVSIRFLPVVQALAPVVAGTVRMPFRRFVGWSAASSVVWSLVYVGVGTTARATYQDGGGTGWLIIVVAVLAGPAVAAVARLVRRYRDGRGVGRGVGRSEGGGVGRRERRRRGRAGGGPSGTAGRAWGEGAGRADPEGEDRPSRSVR
ncbi:DedA family protein [Allostreptomyces psammosilenae]|uniref:Membrane-associated protein n=1 Tax=Allostreptomyces psammosilenae TaxID=1892865 RepID=A0A853A3X5_9ACTN|nr:DedA family protein [Allostreptomyces psammosilenae]NYI07584.1 membrane-associated protein [Allostreptomyces psammosilenae]